MQMCRVETTVSNDGTLTIKGLPFRAGDEAEVIVRSREREQGAVSAIPCVAKRFVMLIHSGALSKTTGTR